MFKKFARFRIIGTLNNLYISPEGNEEEIRKTLYARYWWTAWLKMEYLKIFYDWVDMTPIDEILGGGE